MGRDRTCPIDGRPFRVTYATSTQVYCSQQCVGKSRRTTATEDTIGRRIAAERFPVEQPCEVCGKAGRGRGVIDRHHRNSDRTDNSAANIAFLCRKHHQAAHRLTDGKVGGGSRPRIAALTREKGLRRYREAVPLRAAGLSDQAIAERMGFHPTSVTRWFQKYGGSDDQN